MIKTGLLLLMLGQLALAELEFKSTLNEVHAAADALQVDTLFEFTNTGDEEITISHVDPDCSCVGVQIKGGKLTYQAGESGTIKAAFKLGNSSGTVDQVIAIWLKGDSKDTPSLRLTARIHIPMVVAIEPKSLKWTLGTEMQPQSIRVTIDHEQPIHVTSVTSSKPSFRTELVTIEEGRLYEVVVTPEKMSRPGMAIIRIETDTPIEKQSRQQAFAMVVNTPADQSQP